MGIGRNNFKSASEEYATPQCLFKALDDEFKFTIDVCATKENAKCALFFDKKTDGLKRDWTGKCWMNPPFNRNLKKWVLKAHAESKKHGSLVCCLVPLRGNTLWFRDVCMDAEIRFIIGEVNFNELDRGLWLPMCLMVFGSDSPGTFNYLDYRAIRKKCAMDVGA